GDPYAAEYRMLARDGRTVWVQDAALLVRDAAGRPLCWQGVAYDVTAQREAQAALRERQERLLLALAASGMETWDWDPQTGEVTWPESREELVGTAPPTGRHTFDDFLASVHPDDRALVAAKVGQALAGEGDYDPEYRKLQPDGTVRWHLSRGRVEWDAAGRAVRMRGVVLDITARKEAEAALWASEERLRLALEAAHVGAWDWHLPTDTVVWSPTLCALLGLPAESRTTTTAVYRATFVHPDHRSPAESAKFCVTGEAFAELEYRVVRPDGTVRWFADVGRLVERDPDGAPVRSAGVTIDVTERKALEARLAHDATHDPLTDLPNRALFADRLDQALAKAGERRRSAAVLFLDLDDFRIVNDSLGHAAGDQLLVSVAQRLSSALAPEATLARFGGDEFTVLLPAPTTTHDATQVAEHLLDRLRTPFRLAGRETHVDASVGVAMSSPELACPDDILRAADIALYHAKAAGRATHRVFEPSMAEQAAARLALESDLRRAVEREELLLYYQPEVDLATGAIVGAEALVRWQHPRRGLLGPGEFIPIAEESGLIVPIGAWVLTEACRQLSEWRNLGPTGKRLILGVNLSARQFRQPDLVQRVAATVRAAGLPPRQVKLELTERVVVEDAESETSVLRALRRLGVKLAIDDFGTGYSSLGYLRRWPVDTLKIDRSFVGDVEHDPGGQQLVGAMVGLAHALGADVTAEGIETPGQLSWLQGIGVERGQGYHFTPPMPAEDFVRLLAQNERYNFGPMPKVLPQPAKRGRRRPVQPRPANADRRSCDS
ncbi:MAG: hypothetical protein QOF01_1333, partial [Thermomicrobiales bacterium]|nr:hypothetical protein [Thermomicrobiales bacterium]